MTIRVRGEIVPVMVVCCMLAAVARADEEETVAAISMHKHIWQVRPEVSRFEYKEPGLMKEQGTFYGLGASYTYRPWADREVVTTEGRYLLRLEGRATFGEVDYDGSLSDGTPYAVSDVDDALVEFRILGGRDFLTGASLTTLYFGFGYRYLRDDLSSDPLGYLRESNYFYVPVGLQYTHGLSSEWSLTPCGEFDFLFLGQQVSHLSDLGSGYRDVTNSQPFGYGLRGSVMLQKRFDRFGLAVDPFIIYWDVNKSESKYANGLRFYEPKNWSMEYGLRFIVAF
jgi:hypothetical protein